jgi:hypothetical protein
VGHGDSRRRRNRSGEAVELITKPLETQIIAWIGWDGEEEEERREEKEEEGEERGGGEEERRKRRG